MKIILRKSVPELGEADTIHQVSDGYARNYLIPQGLAVMATRSEMTAAEKRQALKAKKLEERRGEFEELAKKLSGVEVTISADAGESGRLFGSVTSQDVVVAVREKAGMELDRKKIELPEPIKAVGEYKVPVKIYQEIMAELNLKIVAK